VRISIIFITICFLLLACTNPVETAPSSVVNNNPGPSDSQAPAPNAPASPVGPVSAWLPTQVLAATLQNTSAQKTATSQTNDPSALIVSGGNLWYNPNTKVIEGVAVLHNVLGRTANFDSVRLTLKKADGTVLYAPVNWAGSVFGLQPLYFGTNIQDVSSAVAGDYLYVHFTSIVLGLGDTNFAAGDIAAAEFSGLSFTTSYSPLPADKSLILSSAPMLDADGYQLKLKNLSAGVTWEAAAIAFAALDANGKFIAWGRLNDNYQAATVSTRVAPGEEATFHIFDLGNSWTPKTNIYSQAKSFIYLPAYGKYSGSSL